VPIDTRISLYYVFQIRHVIVLAMFLQPLRDPHVSLSSFVVPGGSISSRWPIYGLR
jgi:hypothetical protein